MHIITSQVPYTSKARNAEHDYLFNKLVEAISKEFATKHNFLAYHQRMTAALADENASYTRTTKYVDTDTRGDRPYPFGLSGDEYRWRGEFLVRVTLYVYG